MVRPFWLASGLSLDEIGLITGTLGILASIVGGLTGGFFMVRYGTFHGLWFLGLWQSLSNLTYVWIAVYPQSGHFGVYVASAVESFCAGLGTSAFLAFLMSISKKEFSATQYAVFSALFRVTGIIAGSLSGWATEHMGYAHYFALTFFLSLPAFLFIFHAKRWIPSDQDVNGAG
jgi:MFS transporter, PAT family, beta-lactamase induction signal transducer AmpG